MTDHELDQPATRRDLRREVLGLEDRLRFLERHFDDKLSSQSEELRRHFSVVAGSFKADFANLFDWAQSTTSTMGGRIDGVEAGVTALERRRKN